MSAPPAQYDTREQTADALAEIVTRLQAVHARCRSHRDSRLIERGMEYLRDAEMLARQQHHT